MLTLQCLLPVFLFFLQFFLHFLIVYFFRMCACLFCIYEVHFDVGEMPTVLTSFRIETSLYFTRAIF